jgi:hypothetical protein
MMYDCAGRSFIMLLNTRYLCNLWQQAHTHRPWSDNPIAKTRTSSCLRHSRGQTQTGTRIQTHQNLFTLTKNILFLNIEAGNKHPGSVGADLCRNRTQRKPKLDFPHKRLNPTNSAPLTTPRKWWRWTESNRRPPACKAGALPIELHPRLSADHAS